MIRLTIFTAALSLITMGSNAQAPQTSDDLVQQLTPPSRSLNGGKFRKIDVEKRNEAEIIAAKATLPKANMRVQFEYNSAQLTQEGRDTLKVLADALKNPALATERFLVAGHTDARGSDIYNKGLSDARALSVKNHLVNTYQIEPERLDTIGLGERDLADKANPESPENRRVEIVTQLKQ
jgi:outer membrane protein OmpA-like peptidoglycan-associated protein